MELSRELFRAMIFYDYKSSLNEEQSLERLKSAFGDSAPSRSTVFRWYAEYKRGRHSLNDEARCGRPSTAVTERNVEAVEYMLRENPFITYEDIQANLGIGSAAVKEIMHDHLKLKKVGTKWVPREASDEQKVTSPFEEQRIVSPTRKHKRKQSTPLQTQTSVNL